jgi:hypothetical protein
MLLSFYMKPITKPVKNVFKFQTRLLDYLVDSSRAQINSGKYVFYSAYNVKGRNYILTINERYPSHSSKYAVVEYISK